VTKPEDLDVLGLDHEEVSTSWRASKAHTLSSARSWLNVVASNNVAWPTESPGSISSKCIVQLGPYSKTAPMTTEVSS